MKQLSRYMGIIVAITATALVAACAKSTGGSDPIYAGNGIVGTGPLGIPAGSAYQFYAQNQQWANYWNQQAMYSGYQYGYYQNQTTMSSTLTLNANYKNVLKNFMGVCDQNNTNIGSYSCDNWLSGGFHDIGLSFSGTTANVGTVLIRSYPNTSGQVQFNLSLPSAGDFFLGMFGFGVSNSNGIYGQYNPMKLDMPAWPINNSQGFQLTGYGPNWNPAWKTKMKVIVNNGKIEDQSFGFELRYQQDGGDDVVFGSGTFNRCQTQNCGF